MKILLACWVGLCCFVSSLAVGPSCECGLYSSSKHYVDRLPLVWYTTCAPDDTSCTCEQRSSACLKECYDDAVFRRPESTRFRWRDTACNREYRLIYPPGELLMGVGASLSWVDDCSSPPTQYKTLPRDPLCCRLSYSGYISYNCA